MKLVDRDKLKKHLDYLIQKEKQLAKECSLSPDNEFERQRRYCFEADALAYGLCENVMDYYIVTDAQPIKRAKWENEYLDDDIWWAECSACKNEAHSRYGRTSTYAYCPNCGAKMGEMED